MTSYKTCAIPMCISTTIKYPNKLFIHVPKCPKRRKQWLQLARRDPQFTSDKSPIFFCEDHFDLPKDMENHMQYRVMGSVSKIRMVPNCIPTKFDCQKRKTNDISTPCVIKKRKETDQKSTQEKIENTDMTNSLEKKKKIEVRNEAEHKKHIDNGTATTTVPKELVKESWAQCTETIVKREISSDEETVDQTEFIDEEAATLDPIVLKFEAEEEGFDSDVREIKAEVIATEEKQSEESLDNGNDIEDLIQKHIIEEELPIVEESIKVVPQYLINGNNVKSRLIIQEKDTEQTNEGREKVNKLINIKNDQKKVHPHSLLKAVYSGSAKFPQVNIYDVAEFFAKDKSYTLERIAKLRDTAIPSVRAWGSALRVGAATVRCAGGALRCSCGEGGCEHRLAALLHLHKAAPPLDLEEACVQRMRLSSVDSGRSVSPSPSTSSASTARIACLMAGVQGSSSDPQVDSPSRKRMRLSSVDSGRSVSPSPSTSSASTARIARSVAGVQGSSTDPQVESPPRKRLLVLSGEARGVSAPSIDEFVHKSGAVLTQELCAAAREHSTADEAYARRLRGGRLDGMLANRAALSVLDRDVVRDILAPPTYNHNVDPVITYMKAVVERRLKIKVEKEGIFLRGDWPMFAATPHAVSETHVLEFHHVKPNETKSKYMFNNMFLPEYRANIHFNMFMTNRNKTYFFLSNADPTKIEVHEVHFDYAFCYDMITKCRKFWEKYVYKHIILFS